MSWIRCGDWRKRWCVTTRMRSARGGVRRLSAVVGVVQTMSIHITSFFSFLRVHGVHARGAPFRSFVRSCVRAFEI